MAQAAAGTSADAVCHMAVGSSVVRDLVSCRSQSDSPTETVWRFTNRLAGTSTCNSRFPECEEHGDTIPAATMARAAMLFAELPMMLLLFLMALRMAAPSAIVSQSRKHKMKGAVPHFRNQVVMVGSNGIFCPPSGEIKGIRDSGSSLTGPTDRTDQSGLSHLRISN